MSQQIVVYILQYNQYLGTYQPKETVGGFADSAFDFFFNYTCRQDNRYESAESKNFHVIEWVGQ